MSVLFQIKIQQTGFQRFISVSYTHLDVYKRQRLSFLRSVIIHDPLQLFQQPLYQQPCPVKTCLVRELCQPDVYKRQGQDAEADQRRDGEVLPCQLRGSQVQGREVRPESGLSLIHI